MMNVLYLGKYRERFTNVIKQINNLPANSRILELCFGDTYIADYCKKSGYQWQGIDINKHFVERAQKLGYKANFEDLVSLETFPKADVCVMIGSLYHFHPNTSSLLSKMFKAAHTVVISEPVSNLSSKKGIIGFLAKRAANAGKGKEEFRYDTASFLDMIKRNATILNYQIISTQHGGKDLLVKLIKNESDRY